MDLLSQHEAFLRAIYDVPEDDTPRLVYADFLEEHGDPDKAAYIRYEIEAARAEDSRRAELEAARQALIGHHNIGGHGLWPWYEDHTVRGLPVATMPTPMSLRAELLADPDAYRQSVVRHFPEWFGTTAAKLHLTPIRPERIEVLLALPFTQRVTEWDFGGHVQEVTAGPDTEDGGTFGLIDMVETPVITVAGVEALAGLRAARRITTLVLTHNNLDNDAARALVRSPYLANLKKLDLYDGNRFRGKTWAQLVERFGEGVVG